MSCGFFHFDISHSVYSSTNRSYPHNSPLYFVLLSSRIQSCWSMGEPSRHLTHLCCDCVTVVTSGLYLMLGTAEIQDWDSLSDSQLDLFNENKKKQTDRK